MPRGFAFPDNGQAWVPFVPERNELHGNRGYAGAIGRLKPGVTPQLAQRDLDVIMERLAREFPQENEGWRAEVVPMRDDLVGNLKRPLQVFAAAVVLVLLIACANVANLTLTRGAARQREIAVRTALGAGRGRIVRQLVTESLILSALGGVLGAVITVYGVRLLRLGFPNDVPYYIPHRRQRADARVRGDRLARSPGWRSASFRHSARRTDHSPWRYVKADAAGATDHRGDDSATRSSSASLRSRSRS